MSRQGNSLVLWKALSAFFLASLATIASCARQPEDIATSVPPTEIIPPLRIGLADSAETLVEILDNAASLEAFQPNIYLIPGNDETLVDDVSESRFTAALVYSLPIETTLWFNPVALDGLTIIGHLDNPISDLELDDVRAIFRGEISNWAEVGGNETPIKVFIRETGSGVQQAFVNIILEEESIMATAFVAPGHQPMLSSIQEERGAIGLSTMSASEGVKTFSISGIRASPENTSTQEYLLTIPLYFVSQSEPQGELRAFLSWLQSAEGQTIMGEKYGRVR